MSQKEPEKIWTPRNIAVALLIIVGVTSVWMGFMFMVLKIFAAGYIVLAWVIFGGIAYLILRKKK